jgi:hypothetical protein
MFRKKIALETHSVYPFKVDFERSLMTSAASIQLILFLTNFSNPIAPTNLRIT